MPRIQERIIANDVIVSGNLKVSGNIEMNDSTNNLNISDKIIELGYGINTGASGAGLDMGIVFNGGSTGNTGIMYNADGSFTEFALVKGTETVLSGSMSGDKGLEALEPVNLMCGKITIKHAEAANTSKATITVVDNSDTTIDTSAEGASNLKLKVGATTDTTVNSAQAAIYGLASAVTTDGLSNVGVVTADDLIFRLADGETIPTNTTNLIGRATTVAAEALSAVGGVTYPIVVNDNIVLQAGFTITSGTYDILTIVEDNQGSCNILPAKDNKDIVFRNYYGHPVATIMDGGSNAISNLTSAFDLVGGFSYRSPVFTISSSVILKPETHKSGSVFFVNPAGTVVITLPVVGTLVGICYTIITSHITSSNKLVIKTGAAASDNNDSFIMQANILNDGTNNIIDLDGDTLSLINATGIGAKIKLLALQGGANEIWHADINIPTDHQPTVADT